MMYLIIQTPTARKIEKDNMRLFVETALKRDVDSLVRLTNHFFMNFRYVTEMTGVNYHHESIRKAGLFTWAVGQALPVIIDDLPLEPEPWKSSGESRVHTLKADLVPLYYQLVQNRLHLLPIETPYKHLLGSPHNLECVVRNAIVRAEPLEFIVNTALRKEKL